MIKFFRKIRQKMLTENKFSKYLIYAIGEIILVVIGILIALQINNWNEVQKGKMKATTILKEIRSDMFKDLELKYNCILALIICISTIFHAKPTAPNSNTYI